MTFYSLILTFIEGILTFISPCILPLLPVYVFYLAGVPDDGNGLLENKHKKALVINSLGFVAGFTLVFVILGAAATSIGRLLKENQDILRKVSSVVIMLFGLGFLGVVKPGFLNKEKRFDYKFDKLGFMSSILFGAVFGFSWTPCVGPFLFTALSTAGNLDTVWQGILLLLIYSIGLGIPFVLTAMAFEQIKGLLKSIQKYSRIIQIVSGIVLILAGIGLFFKII